ncbi:MAG: CaiB/BaiF CoA transferase family protein, partial [Candidatus Binatia bacterium]
MTDDLRPGPLDGIRVLDFSRVLAGPVCGRMLVDLGADVVKIEPPQGDLTRFFIPRKNSISLYFVQQNVGKRNISVDIARPEGVELVLKLVPHMDVVLENNRPGVMDRLGLGYETMRELNPRLVYASISGYGQQRSPWRDRPAYAPTVHADMGILDGIARLRGVEPFHDPYSHADLYTGHQCTIAICAALVDRERTGAGTRIDVSMAETTLFVNEHLSTTMSRDEDTPPVPQDNRSPMFRTKEGHYVTVAGDPTPRGIFGAWCTVLEREDLKDDPRFVDDETRRHNRPALLEIIQEWIGSFDDLEDLEAALQKGRIVLGVVRSLREAVHSPWATARGAVVHVPDRGEGTVHVPNTPWRFDGMRTGVRGEPAYRGEHNREVFKEIAGLSDEELDT